MKMHKNKTFFFKLLLLSFIFSIVSTQQIIFDESQNQQSLNNDPNPILQPAFKQNELKDQPKAYPNANFLKDVEFSGTYKSLGDKKLFDYLDTTQGLMQSRFFYDTSSANNMDTQFNALAIQLFNPVYHDRKFVVLILNFTDRISDNKWKVNLSQIQFGSFWQGRTKQQKTLTNINYTITINNIQTQDLGQVSISLQVSGDDFQITSQMYYDTEKWGIIGYSLYVSAIVLGQILCLARLLYRIDNDAPHIAQKISLTTVSICNIMDFYLTIIHIQYIIASVSSYYLFYILPAVSYIFLFIIYDMKLLFMVWRSHTMRQIDNPQDIRKSLTIFYIKFYIGLFLYLAAMYFFAFDQWFIILQNLVIIPQIVRNARVGNNPGFQPFYVLGYLGLRFLIPLYQRTCPQNHFLLMPMVGIIITLAILYVIQIVILACQYRFGPRFFIPKIFQPDYFDYRSKIKLTQQTQQLQCTICIQSFFENNDNRQQLNSSSLNSSSLSMPLHEQQNVMKTPCNHYFHRDCLMSWVDVKLQCPTCRSPLPPL